MYYDYETHVAPVVIGSVYSYHLATVQKSPTVNSTTSISSNTHRLLKYLPN